MCLSEKARYRVKGVWPRAAAFRLGYVATFLSLLCLCVSALPSAPVVLCLQELKLVLDPVTGIRSCEFQLLRWGLLWEKNKRRADKKLVQSPRQRTIQEKKKRQTKNQKNKTKHQRSSNAMPTTLPRNVCVNVFQKSIMDKTLRWHKTKHCSNKCVAGGRLCPHAELHLKQGHTQAYIQNHTGRSVPHTHWMLKLCDHY